MTAYSSGKLLVRNIYLLKSCNISVAIIYVFHFIKKLERSKVRCVMEANYKNSQ